MTENNLNQNPTPGLEENKEARQWAMFTHLAVLAGYIVPFGNVIGPLVVWLMKRNDYPFVDEQGKESLNFQITILIAFLICIPLMFVLIGIPLMVALAIADLVLVIMATIKTSSGEHYRYPWSIRFIK